MKSFFDFLTICVLAIGQVVGLGVMLAFLCFLILVSIAIVVFVGAGYMILRLVGVDADAWLDKQL